MSQPGQSYGGNAYGGAQQGGRPMQQQAQKFKYICADCNGENEIRQNEPIRCKECGHRIMYKPRTTRS
ncbi:hypothetical protein NliqN6_4089 [Naganishia liquefaciens]|uniref:DNA-directed RNA polymerase subunit P n=1 Tax=Naganishia liquefaciens TaxID=104408 RepID=A0A8H3YGY9_9TREE|nr:hypothetical protein NliqN6_4089 [Naganishia liquefaciens]